MINAQWRGLIHHPADCTLLLYIYGLIRLAYMTISSSNLNPILNEKYAIKGIALFGIN